MHLLPYDYYLRCCCWDLTHEMAESDSIRRRSQTFLPHMQNIWCVAAIWTGLAFIASLILIGVLLFLLPFVFVWLFAEPSPVKVRSLAVKSP